MKNSEIGHCEHENEFSIKLAKHIVECDYCILIIKMCLFAKEKFQNLLTT
jgi:hypothetical protein